MVKPRLIVSGSEFRIVMRSASEYVQALTFASFICAFTAMGALIGFAFPSRPRLQIVASIVASVALFALLEWRFGGPTEWSWQYPMASLYYLFLPFVVCFATPAVLASLLVGRWCKRRNNI